MSMTRMTNNELIDELIDELDGIIAILETMNAEDCAASIEELSAVADLLECAPARTLTAAELAEFAELAAAAKARAAAANEMITLIFAKDVEIIRLTEERDEARREVCRLMSMFNAENSVEIAASRSWDCFENKETQ